MILFLRFMQREQRGKTLTNISEFKVEQLYDITYEFQFEGKPESYHPIVVTWKDDNGNSSVEYDICDLECM